jgi:hypothetical protein
VFSVIDPKIENLSICHSALDAESRAMNICMVLIQGVHLDSCLRRSDDFQFLCEPIHSPFGKGG